MTLLLHGLLSPVNLSDCTWELGAGGGEGGGQCDIIRWLIFLTITAGGGARGAMRHPQMVNLSDYNSGGRGEGGNATSSDG